MAGNGEGGWKRNEAALGHPTVITGTKAGVTMDTESVLKKPWGREKKNLKQQKGEKREEALPLRQDAKDEQKREDLSKNKIKSIEI